MTADLLPLSDLGPADLAAWRTLAAEALEPNPYFEPDFVVPAASGLESEAVGLLVVRNGGRWDGALPVVHTRNWRRLPLPGLAAWVHSYCLLGTPLIAPGSPDATLAALLARARREPRSAYLVVEWFRTGGPVGDALRSVLASAPERPYVAEHFERAALLRRDQETYLDGRLSGKRRKELRRLRGGLERELGAELTVDDRPGDAGAVEDFLRLEASGWKGREGTAMASVAGHAEFFRAMCERFAAEGRLELLALRAGERPVAMQCNLLGGDGLFCFKVAYDDELARYSVGTQLEVEAIGAFHRREAVGWMDSCSAPDNELLNRLWADRFSLETVVLPAGTRLRHATRPAMAALDAARRLKTAAVQRR